MFGRRKHSPYAAADASTAPPAAQANMAIPDGLPAHAKPAATPQPPVTQQDQDEADGQKRREALRDLVESWMERLQLISVISTFFASTESGLLSLAMPRQGETNPRAITQVATIGMITALVVHTSAAIISFLAAFFLIRYKLKVATREERDADGERPSHEKENEHEHDNEKRASPIEAPGLRPGALSGSSGCDAETGRSTSQVLRARARAFVQHATDPIPGPIRIATGPMRAPVWSSNPHIIQVGPFQNHPPTHLLRRCHTLCVILTSVGFLLALMGILCFAWDRLPQSVSIAASVATCVCASSAVFILFKPYPEAGTSRQIYVLDNHY